MLFNVLPGIATECVCNFDLTAPKVQLKRFGYFHEKIDPAGRLVGGPSKLMPTGAGFPVERREAPPAGNRGVMYALGGAIALLLALIALVAYPRFFGGATGAVHITSRPPGASIEVDGSDRGVTGDQPLVLEGLEVDRTYKITASRDGWQSVTKYVKPVEGNATTIAFELVGQGTRVQLDSDPQGAEVYFRGEKRGVTPFTDEELPPGEAVELVFKKTGYQDLTRKLEVPGSGGQAMISPSLQMARNWGSVSISSEPGDASVYQNGTLQTVTTPADGQTGVEHLVPAGKTQRFTIKKPGYMPAHRGVTVDAGERGVPVHVLLQPGGGLTVTGEGLPGGTVTVVGVEACNRRPLPMEDCPLADGEYRVRVECPRPFLRHELSITIARNEVTHDLQLGFVAAAAGHVLDLGRNRQVTKAAFPEGKRPLVVVNQATRERQTIEVRVLVGKTITLP
jgi:hypothetical protein